MKFIDISNPGKPCSVTDLGAYKGVPFKPADVIHFKAQISKKGIPYGNTKEYVVDAIDGDVVYVIRPAHIKGTPKPKGRKSDGLGRKGLK